MHPKIFNLAEALNLPRKISSNAQATGMIISLWLWAAINAPDGNLTGCSVRAIAYASCWPGKPEVLFDALVSCGWIDEEDGEYRLHDWEEYAALYIAQVDAQKEKTRERVRAFRERQKASKCNVTVTECNAPTIPNQTITKPNLYDSSSTSSATSDKATEEEGGGSSAESEKTETAEELCKYFEGGCSQKRSKALRNSFSKSLAEGAEAEMIRAVIDETALANVDKPALYVTRILENLRNENIKTLTAYNARSQQYRTRTKGKGVSPSFPTEALEQDWIDRVRTYTTTVSAEGVMQ